MLFSEIAAAVSGAEIFGPDVRVSDICYDSRKVTPGALFVAMHGGSFDAHDYIQRAHEAGAVAFIVERGVDYLDSNNIPYLIASDGRRAMGMAATAFYGYPSRKLTLIAVTGTSGKTSVTHMLQTVYEANGIKAGYIGTLGAMASSRAIPTNHTTPESADVQQILAQMVDDGVHVVAMEASSHGLFQGRTQGCEFDCGIFTNIARDHLDFHETPEAYLQAKLILFKDYPDYTDKTFHAIINADDPAYSRVAAASRGKNVSFGIDNKADITASNINVQPQSIDYILHAGGTQTPIHLNIGAAFNVYNSLAVAAACISLGMNISQVAEGLSKLTNVPGRFESVDCGQNFSVIVDYAHTPDEIENVLTTASKLPHSKLIVVFGCGGDRDRGKRPIMGAIASKIADITFVTSDNPRSEDPELIIQEILGGIEYNSMGSVQVVPDRRSAIFEAIKTAKAGDIVVIAGKGHEDYQILLDRTIHFDDREVAREALKELVN